MEKNIDLVIQSFKQGEADSKELKIVKEELKKYKAMWEELKEGKYLLVKFDDEGYHKENHFPSDIEQKYFPKLV